ncbi:MAG: CarD family transcriptional regulator [Lachnospiraceae bacterium]|nr:CarD family transcriptional regulator [Lachnospiraceae bacterium]
MFEKGDYIVYGNNGVCVVDEVTKMQVKGVSGDKKYYKLSPIANSMSKIFTPVDNDKVTMRKVMTKTEAEELIASVPAAKPLEIENDKQREEIYKQILKDCNPYDYFRAIKTLYSRKMERFAQGKKNTSVDERYFKQIETNLYGEIAIALECNPDEVTSMIQERIGEN